MQNIDLKSLGLELKETNMLNASQNCDKKEVWFSFYKSINFAQKCNICSVFDFFLWNLWLKAPVHTHTELAEHSMNRMCSRCIINISNPTTGGTLIEGDVFGRVEYKSLLSPMKYNISSGNNLEKNVTIDKHKYDIKIEEMILN